MKITEQLMFEFEYLNQDHKKQVLEFINFLKDKEENSLKDFNSDQNPIIMNQIRFERD